MSNAVTTSIAALNATVHKCAGGGCEIVVNLPEGWTVQPVTVHDSNKQVCFRRSNKAAAERDLAQAAIMVAVRMLDPSHRHNRFSFLPLTFTAPVPA